MRTNKGNIAKHAANRHASYGRETASSLKVSHTAPMSADEIDAARVTIQYADRFSRIPFGETTQGRTVAIVPKVNAFRVEGKAGIPWSEIFTIPQRDLLDLVQDAVTGSITLVNGEDFTLGRAPAMIKVKDAKTGVVTRKAATRVDKMNRLIRPKLASLFKAQGYKLTFNTDDNECTYSLTKMTDEELAAADIAEVVETDEEE